MPRFSYDFPYSSQRMPVFAKHMVATSQPLAAQAGLRMMMNGGNAIDAALATAIALTVVEPTGNGLGSDAFAIFSERDGSIHGVNASGKSPRALTPEHFAGKESIPLHGWDAVMVPGAVKLWYELSERHGALPFAELFRPAIEYAEDGFPVSPLTAFGWQRAAKMFKDFAPFQDTFVPGGVAPGPGDTVRLPDHAQTLRSIAETNGDAFYYGEIAEKIAAFAAETGGLITEQDLAEHENIWCGTMSQAYGHVELHQIPPNGQGLAALIALGILQHHPVADSAVDSADSIHVQIEAMKLGLADAHRYICDPEHLEFDAQHLLDPDYLAVRAREIDMKLAKNPGHGVPRLGGTVYLATGDADGRMVSFIQSNYHGFGSGIVIPGTGIALQNRGAGFSLERDHPNRVAGAKRAFHTIIPGFLTQHGKPLSAFGVMGGPVQAQGQLQVVIRMVDYGQNPQTALDAPRWHIIHGREIAIERGLSAETLGELSRRGHLLNLDNALIGGRPFGGAQMVYRTENGFIGATDPRKDGLAAGF